MPSPFPGMDPYLEHPGRWLSLHNSFITHLSDDLNEVLGRAYVARQTERVLVEHFDAESRSIYPDVHLIATKTQVSGTVATESDPALHITVAQAEFTEASIEIVDVAGETLVTVIELLSYANKTPGAQGRDLYQKKQREVRNSQVHLVEIDLLRTGAWALAVPEHLVRRRRAFDYLVCVNRAETRDE